MGACLCHGVSTAESDDRRRSRIATSSYNSTVGYPRNVDQLDGGGSDSSSASSVSTKPSMNNTEPSTEGDTSIDPDASDDDDDNDQTENDEENITTTSSESSRGSRY